LETSVQFPHTGRGSALDRDPLNLLVCLSKQPFPIVEVISPLNQLCDQLHLRLLAPSGSSFSDNMVAKSLDSHSQHFDSQLVQDASMFTADLTDAELDDDSKLVQEIIDSSEKPLIADVPCLERQSPPPAFATEHDETKELTATEESSDDDEDVNSAYSAPEIAAAIAPLAVEPVPSLQTAFSTRRFGTA
jgi:hypothetical protein